MKSEAGGQRLLLTSLTCNYHNELPLEFRLFLNPCQQRRNCAALDMLKHLSQVISERGLSISQNLLRILEKGGQAVRTFVVDERMRRIFIDFYEAAARGRFARRKAAKGEAMHRQAGEHQGHHKGRRAGDHGHSEARG